MLTQGVLLVIDKPKGLNCRAASAKAVEQYNEWISDRSDKPNIHQERVHKKRKRGNDGVKIGHAGTLDPMATGCLPVLLGQATKLQDHLPIDIKRYTAHLRLGVKTDSDDADGTVIKSDDTFQGLPLDFNLEPLLVPLRGKIMQTPPIYSAIHVDGKRAYDLARAGETPTIPPREVHVHQFRAKVLNANTLQLDITCGTGTYIRTLGTDLAKALGTEGHLVKLRRVSSGPFHVLESRGNDEDGSVDIVRALSLREAIETFADVVDITDSKSAQTNLTTGRSANLFRDIASRVIKRHSDDHEVKVALAWENIIRALVVVNYNKEVVNSLCHFKEDEQIPSVDSLVQRQFSSPVEKDDELRVMQFNILADGLSWRRPDLGGFSNISRACLNWEFRRSRIVEEINRCRPHVIGLQEVDHSTELHTAIGHNYEMLFKPKASSPCLEYSNHPDGTVLFIDKTRFRLVSDQQDESFPLGENHNQIAACMVVEDLKYPGHKYVLCAAHFKATKNEHGAIIRAKQAETILANAKTLISKYSASSFFLCTDMNAVPSEQAYSIITNYTKSSMAELLGGAEPNFTSAKQRGDHCVQHTLDYIFYANTNTSPVRPTRYLEIPSSLGYLPNWRYPSDHFALCVGFSRS